MKKLLDQLIARQARLMAQLGPPTTDAADHYRRPVLTDRERVVLRRAEEQAIESTFEHLALGRLDAAAALLEPHLDTAQDTRTLTTLGRIYALRGDDETALALYRRAEALDPADLKVAHFIGALLVSRGRHQEAIPYWRRLAFSTAESPAAAVVKLVTSIVKATPKGAQPPLGELRVALTRLKAASDASNALRQEAARILFPVEALKAEARALYQSADPCPEGARDVDATWHKLPDWCATNGARINRNLAAGKPRRRPMVAELRKVIVHPQFQWIPMVEGGSIVFSDIGTRRMRTRDGFATSPLLMDDGRRALLRLPHEMTHIEQPALLIGGVGHYFHDTVEHLGALGVAEGLGVVGDLPLVVNDDLAPHQAELLDLLGYDERRLLRVPPDRALSFDWLLVPSRPLVGGRWIDPAVPLWYRQRLPRRVADAEAPRKLYVSRRLTATRRVANEDDVVAQLLRLGYVRVEPEMLSVREQMKLFSHATHVVGAAGAALTNMIHAAPGARIVILHNRLAVKAGADLYYDALARACAHTPSVLECSATNVAPGVAAIDADIEVDVRQLCAVLDHHAAPSGSRHPLPSSPI